MLRIRLAQAAAVTALASSFLMAAAGQAPQPPAHGPQTSASAPTEAPVAAGTHTMGWS